MAGVRRVRRGLNERLVRKCFTLDRRHCHHPIWQSPSDLLINRLRQHHPGQKVQLATPAAKRVYLLA